MNNFVDLVADWLIFPAQPDGTVTPYFDSLLEQTDVNDSFSVQLCGTTDRADAGTLVSSIDQSDTGTLVSSIDQSDTGTRVIPTTNNHQATVAPLWRQKSMFSRFR